MFNSVNNQSKHSTQFPLNNSCNRSIKTPTDSRLLKQSRMWFIQRPIYAAKQIRIYCNWWMRIPLLYINSRVVRKHIVLFNVQQVVNYFTNGKVRSPTNCRCWRIANAVSALPFTAAWAPKLTAQADRFIAAWMGLWPLGYIANLWTCVIRVVLVALSRTTMVFLRVLLLP